jgi:hypothetical protein
MDTIRRKSIDTSATVDVDKSTDANDWDFAGAYRRVPPCGTNREYCTGLDDVSPSTADDSL